MKAVPHCRECGNELEGNGSVVFPYACECGIWEFNPEKEDWKLKKIEYNDKCLRIDENYYKNRKIKRKL